MSKFSKNIQSLLERNIPNSKKIKYYKNSKLTKLILQKL